MYRLFILGFLSFLTLSTSVLASNIDALNYIVTKSAELQTLYNNYHEHLVQINRKDYVLVEKDISFLNKRTVDRHRFENAVFGFLEDHQYAVDRSFKRRQEPTKHELRDNMAYLTVALVMYDNFLTTQLRLYGLKKIRRFLNTPDQAIGKRRNLFKRSIQRFTGFRFRRLMRRAIKIYENRYLQTSMKDTDDIEMQVMHTIIQKSYTYQRLAHQNFWEDTKDFLEVLNRKMKIGFISKIDFINKAGKETVYYLSKLFGNTVGMVQFRNGYLYNDADFLKQVRDYAKPLDIILEKTPFRLTDRFIPGFWGHTAIYIGNEIQLRELGLWDHPEVVKYHESIKLGQNIVEALRSGVEINSFKHFSNIDDFALIRSNTEWDEQEARESILRAISQIGKTYDFAFDVETPTKIVCSELHYTVFRNLSFKTTKVAGRYTINVDQVSVQAYSGGAFSPHILYLNGVEVTENIQAEYDKIIEQEQGNPDKALTAEQVDGEWKIHEAQPMG